MEQLSDINPFDADVIENPYDFNRQLRDAGPVHRDPHTGFYLVARFDLVEAILKDTDRFSSRFQAELRPWDSFPQAVRDVYAQGYGAPETLLTADPPHHTESRALVSKAFSLKRVRAMRPFMEEKVDALLDELLPRGRMEFRNEFALVLPLLITAQQFQVPDRDIDKVKHWSDIFAEQLGQAPKSDEALLREAREIVDFQHYFADKLNAARKSPAEDIISVIAQALDHPDKPIDMGEAIEIITQTFVAGHETTTSAMTSGMKLLIDNPDQLAKLQADPDLIPNFCEEVLRLESPTNNMWRITREDVELDGINVPKGSMLLLRFGGANRDERKFGADAAEMDVARRNAREHLAFGAGPHFCIGAIVARQEMEVAFRKLLPRAANFRLDPDGPPLQHHYSVLLRGYAALNILFDPIDS